MTEVTTPPESVTPPPPAPDAEFEIEKKEFLDRLGKETTKRKEAAALAAASEKRAQELEARLEAVESANLPDLDREKKRAEAAEKRAEEAEAAGEKATKQVAKAHAERLVIAAARDFHDPDDAVRNVNLDDIESAEDAERAVKRVAKAKQHLLKAEDKPIPGKVLKDGKVVEKQGDPLRTADEDAAQGMLDEINKMRKGGGYQSAGNLS